MRFYGLGPRWAAACDVPDLELFPRLYPGVRTVEFRAALELGVQQSALWVAAFLRRHGVQVPLERWAGALGWIAARMNVFGGTLGGMLVSVSGRRADGSRARAEWHLTADALHGPEIPCMAAVLLAQKIKRGELPVRGALPCVGLLSLGDFQPEFARWGMSTDMQEFAL